MASRRQPTSSPDIVSRMLRLDPVLILLVILLGSVGSAALYSIADGSMRPWALTHISRFGAAFGLMLVVALVPLRAWLNLAVPLYLVTVVMLFAVALAGDVGGGGRRWILLGPLRLQPSEFMKVAIVLVLASYYHVLSLSQVRNYVSLLLPFFLLVLPCVLVARQPDLGTTILIGVSGLSVVFLSGAPKRIFLAGIFIISAAIPTAWKFLLRDYQKGRVLTFLDPSRDPLGAGYHITQSKIAIGSGGVQGKGFLGGTQSHLNFLPEMHTDFIFTTIAEEHGLLGGLALLALFGLYLVVGLRIAFRARSQFARLIAAGLSTTVFFYIFINVGMVMGLLPVVGVPLPLISYGGSATLTFMGATGLLLACHINRDVTLPKV